LDNFSYRRLTPRLQIPITSQRSPLLFRPTA